MAKKLSLNWLELVENFNYLLNVLALQSTIEALLVTVKINPFVKILIFAVYIPPHFRTGPTAYDLFGYSVIYANSTCNDVNAILITGDFNLPRFDWCNPVAADASPSVKAVLDLASQLDLSQISNVLNSRGVQLDLVFGCPKIFSLSLAKDNLLSNEDCHPGLAITASLAGWSRVPT